MRTSGQKSGFTVLEIVVAAAIIVSVVTATTGAWQLYLRLSNNNTARTQAALLTDETIEALNLFRDTSWSRLVAPLSLGTPYYLYWDGAKYATSTSVVATSSGFKASVTLASVFRDSNKDITVSGGTVDPRSRLGTVTIGTSATSAPAIMITQFYIHDVFQN